jgi:hypothetical protein
MRPALALALLLSSSFACDAKARPPSVASATSLPTGKTIACGQPKLVEGRQAAPLPSLPKPRKGTAYDEPTFHTCVTRATDHAAEGIDTFARHDYSRRQAFNADSSLFLINSRDGGWYLYETKTLRKLHALEGLAGDAEPQWHPTDPNVLYYGYRNGGLEIMAIDARQNRSKGTFIDLRNQLPWPHAARAWTKSEGAPSRDARYWGFQVETENFEIIGFAVWDAVAKKLLGTMPSKSRPDHVSMSPSGRWFVVSGEEGTIAWSPDFRKRRVLHKKTEHSDLAIGANGHDYYVSIDYQVDGNVFMVDIDTGERTDLFRTYVNGAAAAIHFSGKAYDKPGWVLASTYNDYGPSQWYMGKVFALELAANPRVYQLAAHHSAVKDAYFAEPQATVNRDFTLALFNSNWGVPASNDVDAYLIRIPKGAFP